MFKSTGTDLDTHPTLTRTPTQQALTCALQNAKLLLIGCCCIYDSLHCQLAMCKISFSRTWGFQQPQQSCLARSKPSFCICSPPPTKLCVRRWGGHCAWILIRPYLLPRRISVQFYWVFLQGKLPVTCGSSTTGLRLTLNVRSKNISLSLTTISGSDEVGLWLGLPGHRTSHQCTSSYGIKLKSGFTRRQLILKRILLPV